ncbi:MAG TPA: ATP-binding protein [Ilumatobacteraceae bacterium]|nr:ATP-binding protein [Ilumatobacteraceae bacterium]
MRGLTEGLNIDAARQTRRSVFLVSSLLLVAIGIAIYPFRSHDYELQFLLVLPVLLAGAFAGRTVAVTTALVAVVTFHLVTRTGSTKIEEDVIAFITFLGSALAVGAAVGGGVDRLTLARKRAAEQERLRDLSDQISEAARRVAVLEQVDKQRAALLRSVSHDLRTPLATIRAVATDLRDADVHDEVTRQELLKSVSDEAERLDRLVANLLNMSRIEAGSMHVDDQAVDLAEVVQSAVLRLSPTLANAVLEVEVAERVPLITGDPVLLDEVVSNLLENAGRYAPDGSVVAVRLAGDDGGVVLQVCDSGPGIDEADVGRVFEPFWRGADSRSSGLGLAIARAVVEAHEGSIRLLSTPGRGATFEVRLPARQDARL